MAHFQFGDTVSYDDKIRGWCLTVNNWTENDLELLKNCSYTYIVIGNEIAPDTKTPHLQVYLYFKNARSFPSVKKISPRAHIMRQYANSTADQNRIYCSKECLLFEDGEMPKQGKRTDIDNCRELAKTTNRIRPVILAASSIQGIRIAEKYLEYFEPVRTWEPKVEWFYGRSGSGKSYTAYQTFKPFPNETYTCMDTAQWFQGYDGHRKVIIDDMRGDFTKLHCLLRLLDENAYRVQNKGGSRQFLADHIIITSIFHPAEVFSNSPEEPLEQLIRRIDNIQEFTTVYKKPTQKKISDYDKSWSTNVETPWQTKLQEKFNAASENAMSNVEEVSDSENSLEMSLE